MELAIPFQHKVKIKQNEEWDVNVDLARTLKKLLNVKVKGVSVIDALGTITKYLLRELEELEVRGWT